MRRVSARARNAGAGRFITTRRVSAVVAATALAALALTGCSASNAGSSSCVQEGGASSLVRVSHTGTPTAKFPTPLVSKTVQKSTSTQGDGQTIGKGQMVVGTATIYLAQTGEKLQSGDLQMVAGGSSQAPGLQKALDCSTVGSRIAVTGTIAQLLGSNASQTGLPTGSTLVIAAKISKAYLARADGSPRVGQPGMPTVVLAPNGQPGIKITSKEPPTALRTAVLRQGSGATVTKKDEVLVNYTAVTWADPTSVASSTWGDVPALWPGGQSSSGYTVPKSVTDQLVGRTIGSQLLIVTPGSDATAFVVDLLGVWN